MGLRGIEVEVLEAQRQKPTMRTIVNLRTDRDGYPFQVTDDHRLVIKGSGNSLVTVYAVVLLSRSESYIFNGIEFLRVVDVYSTQELTSVIKVTFAQDEIVLAWVLPKNMNKSGRPPLRDEAAVALKGDRLKVEPLNVATCPLTPVALNRKYGLSVSRTFLHNPDGVAKTHGKARSYDSVLPV